MSLLMKAAVHPLANICAIAISALTRIVEKFPILAHDILTLLQRRAIAPHVREGVKSLESSGGEFDSFRNTILTEALIACYKGNGHQFMDSCTSAIEEFCSSGATEQFSLQLEAALFCVEAISMEALVTQQTFPHDVQMKKIVTALQVKPLMATSFARERMCAFVHKVSIYS